MDMNHLKLLLESPSMPICDFAERILSLDLGVDNVTAELVWNSYKSARMTADNVEAARFLLRFEAVFFDEMETLFADRLNESEAANADRFSAAVSASAELFRKSLEYSYEYWKKLEFNSAFLDEALKPIYARIRIPDDSEDAAAMRLMRLIDSDDSSVENNRQILNERILDAAAKALQRDERLMRLLFLIYHPKQLEILLGISRKSQHSFHVLFDPKMNFICDCIR